MFRLGEQEIGSSSRKGRSEHQVRPRDVRKRWVDSYGPVLAARLEPDRRYALLTIDSADFAYTDSGVYLRVIGQAWEAGYDPLPRPSALGSELPDLAPDLRGIDCSLIKLRQATLKAPANPL
jgi:hypothetical protein